jgi:PsbP
MSLCYDFQKWTILTLGLVAISLTIGLISIAHGQTNSSNAQSSVNFLNATNNIMKFSILVPSNWQLGEDLNGTSQRVWFNSPDRSLPIFFINTKKVEPYLDTDTMTLKNTSIQQHVQQELNNQVNKSSEIKDFLGITDFNIIRQNAVTIGGNNGWKVESKFSWHDDPFYSSRIYTIANGKMYTLEYQDDSLKVPETLPLINKMVESFKVIK